jgi:hypothetical protein
MKKQVKNVQFCKIRAKIQFFQQRVKDGEEKGKGGEEVVGTV